MLYSQTNQDSIFFTLMVGGNVWECIAASGVGEMVIIDKIMDKYIP